MADVTEQLIKAMQEELEGQQELVSILADKLDAMRQYDMMGLESLMSSEQRAIELLRQKGARRDFAVRQLTSRVFPGRKGQPARAVELAEMVDKCYRDRFVAVTSMLKDVAEKAQRLNKINAVASQKVLQHLGHIFRIIARSGHDIGLYSPGGKKTQMQHNQIVDAIA